MPFIELEVEENPNCFGVPLRIFSAKAEPRRVSQVRAIGPDGLEGRYWVTGWSSQGRGSPCPAQWAPVEDSGAAVSHLVYGGDWGIRLRPATSQGPWSLADKGQFGEPYLLLASEGDVVTADPAS